MSHQRSTCNFCSPLSLHPHFSWLRKAESGWHLNFSSSNVWSQPVGPPPHPLLSGPVGLLRSSVILRWFKPAVRCCKPPDMLSIFFFFCSSSSNFPLPYRLNVACILLNILFFFLWLLLLFPASLNLKEKVFFVNFCDLLVQCFYFLWLASTSV